MKKLLILLAIYACGKCLAQDLPVPTGYTIIGKAEGDLDKDGITEWAVVYNTAEITDDGAVREIRVFKQKDKQLVLWKKSREAVYKSKEGGMMGDPFGEVLIQNGILLISHYGGSSWKWGHTDKYRFQNGQFELIGYTSHYGKLCEYWADADFNLSTGKIVYSKVYEDCADEDNPKISKTENETFYQKDIKLNFDNRRSKEVKIVSPKNKYEIYL